MDDKLKQSSPSNSRLPPPSMDIVREFLQYQMWGAKPEDVQRTVVGLHGVNPYRVSQIIAALEQVAADAHPRGTLSQLVMIDGNQMLMNGATTVPAPGCEISPRRCVDGLAV